MEHTQVDTRFRPAAIGGISSATVAALVGLVALLFASPAAATTNGRQLFAWADKATEPFGWGGSYAARLDYANEPAISFTRMAIGEYVVTSCVNPFLKFQHQVVAYGGNDVRCKFSRRSVPWAAFAGHPGHGTCLDETRRFNTWGMQSFVTCTNAAGVAKNSPFVFQLSVGHPENRYHVFQGNAAFVETADQGRAIAKMYRGAPDGSGRFIESPDHEYNVHSSSTLRTSVTRLLAGHYRVQMQGLGTDSPGLAQVTALGGDAAHCKLATLPARSTSSSAHLSMDVRCFIGNFLVDSDFILNYDKVVTRQTVNHQGARAFSPIGTSSVESTPGRSYNSGSIVGGSEGVNRVRRVGLGDYTMVHTSLSPRVSAVYVGAVSSSDSDYCKVNIWYPHGTGALVSIFCFDHAGMRADTAFVETYQGTIKGPQ